MSSKINHFNNVRNEEGVGQAVRLSLKYIISTIPPKGIPYYYQLRSWINWKNSGSYRYRPDPFKIVLVDPREIKFMSKNRFSYLSNKYYDSGLVAEGDWDRSQQEFIDNVVYQSFKMRFVGQTKWIDTPLVSNSLDKLNNGDEVWKGCSSEEDLLKKCSEYDLLYKDIRDNYLTKKEVIKNKEKQPTNPQWFWQAYDEVVVNVGRDGQLLFVGGHHRLSIAKILEIDLIPVRIFVRHAEWQQKIDNIYIGSEDNFNHPDLLEFS